MGHLPDILLMTCTEKQKCVIKITLDFLNIFFLNFLQEQKLLTEFQLVKWLKYYRHRVTCNQSINQSIMRVHVLLIAFVTNCILIYLKFSSFLRTKQVTPIRYQAEIFWWTNQQVLYISCCLRYFSYEKHLISQKME